jgi:hypothetical protein
VEVVALPTQEWRWEVSLSAPELVVVASLLVRRSLLDRQLAHLLLEAAVPKFADQSRRQLHGLQNQVLCERAV